MRERHLRRSICEDSRETSDLLGSRGIIWDHLGSSEITCDTCNHLRSSAGFIWNDLGSSEDHLSSSAIIWEDSGVTWGLQGGAQGNFKKTLGIRGP